MKFLCSSQARQRPRSNRASLRCSCGKSASGPLCPPPAVPQTPVRAGALARSAGHVWDAEPVWRVQGASSRCLVGFPPAPPRKREIPWQHSAWTTLPWGRKSARDGFCGKGICWRVGRNVCSARSSNGAKSSGGVGRENSLQHGAPTAFEATASRAQRHQHPVLPNKKTANQQAKKKD